MTLGAHVLLLLVTASLYLSGYDILPADFTQLPLNLEEDSTKLRADAWKYVRQNSRVSLDPTLVGIQGERTVRYDVLELVYESKGGNVFTRENLQNIQRTEAQLFNNSIYQEKICQITEGQQCRQPMSILRFFDGTYTRLNPVFYDPDFENIAGVLNVANSVNYTRAILDFHLGKNAVIDLSENKAISHYTRSLFYIGYPLKGYWNVEDKPEEQTSKLEDHAQEAFAKILDEKYTNGIESMNFFYFLRPLFFNAISQQVIFDLLLAGASFTFIFLFVLFQTQSVWITGWAVFSILTCFFGANLIYRLILDCRYIGIFHVLSVFIILGIGADDVFVFVDTWKASEEMTFDDLAARLSFVYKRAARAMFITSVTTVVAFMTSVFSPLLGVSTFGIFSALLVFVNYCSVILFFPTVIITYELFWKEWRWNCLGRLKCWRILGQRNDIIARGQAAEEVAVNEHALEPSKIMISFFEIHFFEKIVNHRVMRWVTLAVFFIFLCGSVVYATRLEPDQEAVSYVYLLNIQPSPQLHALFSLFSIIIGFLFFKSFF